MLGAQLVWITGMEDYYQQHVVGISCSGDNLTNAKASYSKTGLASDQSRNEL